MITVHRTYHKQHTSGVLTLPDGSELYTLELKWDNNRVGKSCIPEGRYRIKRDKTGKHQWWQALNVEGRTAIEIHPANYPDQLLGCIALSITPTDDGKAAASTEACKKLLEFFGDSDWLLEIAS